MLLPMGKTVVDDDAHRGNAYTVNSAESEGVQGAGETQWPHFYDRGRPGRKISTAPCGDCGGKFEVLAPHQGVAEGPLPGTACAPDEVEYVFIAFLRTRDRSEHEHSPNV